ncbi:hypothetical protein SANTM175S_05901 [Streptomyces antimycoticus]
MVTTRRIEYSVDGTAMVGHLALPGGTDRRPAVLIAHEGPGLTDHQRERADRLAELGYVAFALDYHGGGRFIEDREEMFARVDELLADPDRMRALAGAGLAVLTAEPRADTSRLAAIGYCLGGTMALELARGGADLKAVVGFHPSLRPPAPRTPPTSPARSWSAWGRRIRSSRSSSGWPSRRRCGPPGWTGA